MAKLKVWLFAPHGNPIHYVLTHGYQNQTPDIDFAGSIDGCGGDQFPNMEIMELPGGGELVVDEENTEFDARYCRPVEVYDGFDVHDFDMTTSTAIEAWPDDIVEACERATALRALKYELELARRIMPDGFEDTTIKAVFDNVIFGKLDGQLAELELEIMKFREGRTEPERLFEDGEMVEGDL